ncbi:N-acyl-D-amino-acid deacylase family protein [Alcaligenes endophyticus]|uniref:D-aminoacylase n=1 Tax=Alcaligenes endophyticus TaxID=1929088 RepID=A0ABT8EG13_9BURK|nr:D-aminoacylase [Alcaligenes endophyticus]MCX5590116.1 D-aminoacylase [Alcaligenes endophyticus]MDN4120221.1 D-aminoacylase [Alcaligenes endophyticus]
MSVDTRAFDLILAGGTVLDGTNAEPFKADVAILNDKIVAIGEFASSDAREFIDISGKVLAPGFIDSHTHDDNALLRTPEMTPKVSQGVTTVITGNCGISLAPLKHITPPSPLDLLDAGGSYVYGSFAEYLEAVRDAEPTVNCACMVGHSTLRAAVMGELDRPANEDEIQAMRAMVSEALEAGAIGVSTGTFYPPAAAASTAEIIEVCQPLSQAQGVYATHMRDEGDEIVAALNETFHIGQALQVPVIISHHKLMGQQNFGRSVETLALISQAMQTQSVSLDAYPYVAGSTMLKKDRALLSARTIITWCTPFPEYTGKDLDEIAQERGKSRWDVVDELMPAGAIYFMMDEEDVQRIMAFPDTMIGSDGLPHDTHPHPRLWGTFPRVLGHYSRDLGLFPLHTAVWKMTGLTAQRFGLQNRGVIAVGAFADLVVFDPATIADVATFEAPMARSKGIHQVYVNGVQVWTEGGAATGARPGRVLERQATH